ncbi:MAG: autotransporter-associated beta strand repeat-containing protein, partial [Luteolibacter sp.]
MNSLYPSPKYVLLCRLLAAVLAVEFSANLASAQDPGITISPSGIMLKDGKPYRAIGGHDPFDSVEWFEGNNANYEQTFADLKASGMKYVRLTTKGYYPWWKLSSLSITDKAAYFAKMDAMINCAAENDIGVMLGLFWTVFAVSEFYGESELAAATPGSKTYVAMAQFCTDMATHYKDNPAVVGYDVIGELSLLPDQPNSGQPANGRWTSEATQVVYANLFQAIRAVDPTRMLSSANGSPPENQFHRTNYSSWNPDTAAQSSYETDISHPDPVDVIGVHYYPTASTGSGVNWDLTNALSLQRRKPLLGGEFGGQAPGRDANRPVLAANFNFALSELLRNRVAVMATWYIGAPQDSSAPYNLPCWTTPTNDFAYQWNALAQANSQYVYRPWKNLATTSGSWNASGSWESGPIPTTADDVYVPTDATTPRSLSITSTAYARNLAVGTAATGNLPATIDINGAGQLVLGQNSDLSIPSTSDGTTANTLTVAGAHGQLLDVSSRSSVLRIQQSTAETKPAIVANTVSAYQMKTSDRANISAETTQLNLFDGMVVGQGASSAATVYQTGGTVRIGLDANMVGGTPAGLVLGAGSSTPKYVLSGGTLATSKISGTTNAVIDWQGGTIRTLDGASMSVSPVVDIQLNTAGIHLLNAADANQSITINATARITGSGNLTKSGPGKLSFLGTSSDYTYSGTTTISDGILQVKNAGALPGWNTGGKVSVGARTSSPLDGTVAIGTLALNVGGSGEWTTANLTTLLGASGSVTFGAGSALGIDTTNAPGTVTLTTPITGSKGITKLGSGNLTLNPSSSNTFTGMTTILGGTLQLGTTANTIIPAGSGFNVRGGTLDLGTKNITFSGTYSALTANNNPKSEVPVPYLTQPSRLIFAGGTVQNGTITNNAQCTDWDSIYEGQSGTVSAILAGSAGLRKTTAGTLTLNGNNTYTGQTTIAKGNLVLGHNNALGTTGNISFNNGSLVYAPGVTVDLSARFQGSIAAIAIDTNGQTVNFASPIASTNGSGLKKLGAGTLILNSANSYTGGTWVQAGTLQTNVDGALFAANDLTISTGAVVDLNGTNQSIANLYSMAGGAWSIVNNKSGTQATLTVSGNWGGNFTGILSNNSTGTGTVALAKSGNGWLTLSGANTFTGPTALNSGKLHLASASGPSMNGNLTVAYGTWLLLTANNQFGPDCAVNLNGEMVLQNTNQTITSLTGSGIVQNDHNLSGLGIVPSGTATLTVNNSLANTFAGLIRDNIAGNGTLTLIKTGNGTLSLTGSNYYTGATTVNGGTLALAAFGSVTATSGVSINNGGIVSLQTVNALSGPVSPRPVTIASGGLMTMNGNHSVNIGAITLNGGELSSGGFSDPTYGSYYLNG